MPACTLALTQPTVRFPWPACHPCGFAIIVVNVCWTNIYRNALLTNANPATLRSYFGLHGSIPSLTNSMIVSIGWYCRAHGRSKVNQLVSYCFFPKNYLFTWVPWHDSIDLTLWVSLTAIYICECQTNFLPHNKVNNERNLWNRTIASQRKDSCNLGQLYFYVGV